MTIVQSFVNFLKNKGYGMPGQNLYLYRVPNSLKTETEVLWIIPSGGTPIRRNKTEEMIKSYQFLIYYRSVSARKVDEVLNDLERVLNCSRCVELEGYELVDIQATQFPTDQDIDSENRMVGMIQVEVQVYVGCNDES